MNQRFTEKICPQCQHKNPVNTIRCEECGSVLESDVSTLPVPDLTRQDQTLPAPPVDLSIPQARLSPGAVALHIPGRSEPIVLQEDVIVLGRQVPNEPPPTVDLTGYYGHLLGVSRRHAMIRVAGTEYVIEDLNSSNGTWVNESRLAPHQQRGLKDGDEIRLGQLILFIRLSSVNAISLSETDNQQPVTSPLYLVQRLGPYLAAIAGLETVLATVQGQEAPVVSVKGINMTAGSRRITIKLEGATNALRMMQDLIMPLRKQMSERIGYWRAVLEQPSADKAQVVSELRPLQNQLAAAILNRVDPQLVTTDRSQYIQLLVEPLETLIVSSLELGREQD